MKDVLNIVCVQSNIIWESPKENAAKYDKLLANISDEVNLIVLPEMFMTGFSMQPKSLAESMNGQSATWMKEKSYQLDCAVMGSLIIEENGNYYNRLIFVHPNGSIQHYDKRHLFTLAGEDKTYTPGDELLIIDYLGWKIAPMICYDLRFPVWSRNTKNYDVLIYVANWPKPRTNAWDTLLSARAIENMSYVIGVNRVGNDENGLAYIGHTRACDVLGNSLGMVPNSEENIIPFQLKKEHINKCRNKFQFLNDKDDFKIMQ